VRDSTNITTSGNIKRTGEPVVEAVSNTGK